MRTYQQRRPLLSKDPDAWKSALTLGDSAHNLWTWSITQHCLIVLYCRFPRWIFLSNKLLIFPLFWSAESGRALVTWEIYSEATGSYCSPQVSSHKYGPAEAVWIARLKKDVNTPLCYSFLFILAVCILLMFYAVKSSRELFVLLSVHECDLLKRHSSAQESGLFSFSSLSGDSFPGNVMRN